MMNEQTKTENIDYGPLYPEDEHRFSGLLEEE